MATDWAPPRSNQAPRPPAPPADLDSPAGELALLRALVAYRLVGPHKHVQMAALLNRLAKDPGMRSLSNRDVWAKWNQLYDADTLEQVWKDQASHAQSKSNYGSEPPAGSSRLPRPSRLDAHYFPVREFSLTRHSAVSTAAAEVGHGDVEETDEQLSLAQLAFQRGQVPPGERAESPAEGPLRQVSIPPGHVLRGSNPAGPDLEEGDNGVGDGDDGEGQSVAADEEATERPTSTRKGKRGRPSSAAGPSSTAAAAVPAPSPKKKRRIATTVENASPSPKKRARTATKGAGDAAAEESELSELSDDDDDEEEEEGGGEGAEEGEGGEGGEAEEGDEEDSDGDTVADDDDDDFAPQSKSKAAKKKKGAAASNRRPAATASETAASRSASPGAAAAAAATPAKTTRAGAAARAKKAEREKSESAATPRSSSRRSGAGGPANKKTGDIGAMYKDQEKNWNAGSLPLSRLHDPHASPPRSARRYNWRAAARPCLWLATLGVLGTIIATSTGGRTRVEKWRLRLSSTPTLTTSSLRTDDIYAYAAPIPTGSAAYEEHPIHALIRNAKKAWADKVERQSKTYEDAVQEYRRRYRRPPPPGFDRWYTWATEHDVQLIDEFDTLSDQIEPFFSLPPSLLRERVTFYEDTEGPGRDHSIVTIKNGEMSAPPSWRDPVPDGFILLMDEAMDGYRQAAREDRWVNEDELPIAGPGFWTNRERQCAPTSPYRREIAGLTITPPPGGPPFVHNHLGAMSYCTDPKIVELHGATSGWPFPQVLRPSLALSRAQWNGDIVWPSTIQYDLNPDNESPFRQKGHKLLWRGSPDGIGVAMHEKWRQSHRFRLINLMNSQEAIPRVVRETRLDNKTMYFAPKASLEEMADNRFVMDVDGNAYSARFRSHLASNQVPFKSTIYPEWYQGRIQPWVHYVPVRIDYADVYNLLAFFDGGMDEERTGNHDDLAEEIANAGAEWARSHWRDIDMQAYVFRLTLEWARLMDPAREKQ
ncbi:hypothetical protein B0A53_03632 [Rhodotorula sp. CCFEE 5036]|nr:hypothetical protein B0A53_03632 [Rhodotorula sp. CCFEE 5036]